MSEISKLYLELEHWRASKKRELAWSRWSKKYPFLVLCYISFPARQLSTRIDTFTIIHHNKSHPQNWTLGTDGKQIQILPFLGEILFHLHLKGLILLEDYLRLLLYKSFTKSLFTTVMGEVQDTHTAKHVHNFNIFYIMGWVLSCFSVGGNTIPYSSMLSKSFMSSESWSVSGTVERGSLSPPVLVFHFPASTPRVAALQKIHL